MATRKSDINIVFGVDISQLSTGLQNVSRELKKTGEQMQTMGKNMSMYVTAPLMALGAAAIYAFSEIDSLKRGLIAVMGSAQAAAGEFEKLREVAKLPGLGLEEAAKGSVQLQAAGFSADEARKALLSFGNALATVGKGKTELNLVILALGQLQNKAGGFGQDLRQLTEQLPQLRGALTEIYGTFASEEVAKMDNGAEVVRKLTEYFSHLPKVTGGIKNAMENLSDSVKISLSDFGDLLDKTFDISGALDKLGKKLSDLVAWFKELNPLTQKLVLGSIAAVAAIGPLIWVIGKLMVVVAALTSPITLLVGAIAAVAAASIWLGSNLDVIGNRIKNVFIGIADAVITRLLDVAQAFQKFAASFGLNIGGGVVDKLLALKQSLPGKSDATEFRDFADIVSKAMDELGLGTRLKVHGKKQKDGAGKAAGADAAAGAGAGSGLGSEQGFDSIQNTKNLAKSLEDLDRAASGIKFNKYLKENLDPSVLDKQLTGLKNSLARFTPTLGSWADEMKSKFSQIVNSFGNFSQGVIDEFNTLLQNAIESGDRKTLESFIKMQIRLAELTKSVEAQLKEFINNSIVSVAERIGLALAGVRDPFRDFGNVLLESLGSMMQQMGALFIAFGTSGALFEDSIRRLEWYEAIAAGVALVAIGSAISYTASKGLSRNGGGGGGSGGGGGGGGYSAGYSSQAQTIGLSAVLRGRDIYLAGEHQSYLLSRGG